MPGERGEMAQMQADGRDAAANEAIPVGRMMHGAAAALSLAVLVGIGVWGYQTVARDVSGIPVIRAAEGSMRVRPDAPGGRPAPHQGLAVNAVAAEGVAAPLPDKVRLAPGPLDLAEDDLTTAELKGKTAGQGDPAQATKATPAAMRALADDIAAGATPLSGEDPSAEDVKTPTPEDLAVAKATGADLSEPVAGGIGQSLRPRPRPARLVKARVSAAATPAPVEAQPAVAQQASAPSMARAVEDVDPATITPGTRLAQLGAFDTREMALEDWQRLDRLFGDYLDGKKRVIQEASAGGRAFFRLRVMGFADLSDARRFCAAFVAQDAECIPVVTK